ncbi:hypothetical protein [Clostridium cibarium]|uniref:Inclusion body protein n=1 Tax=Clostridium cibarium TaxID=2762247 RepID=A0ABR8PV47_9CLOT|nr:hypothetical protein [Clostridium cibarium]MBD7912029.1 hypothetical protein [Clostridium cibarium]
MVPNICNPRQEGSGSEIYWRGVVDPNAQSGSYQYSVNLILNDNPTPFTFDPFIIVS